MTDETQEAPADAPQPDPTPAKPARVFPRTRFPKLPVLDAKQLAKLSPQMRAKYHAEKKHEDDWGHLAPNLAAKLRGVEPSTLSPNAVELHAKSKQTDPVHFAAAKAFHKWAIGQEMTPAEYDAAVEAVLSHKHGV